MLSELLEPRRCNSPQVLEDLEERLIALLASFVCLLSFRLQLFDACPRLRHLFFDPFHERSHVCHAVLTDFKKCSGMNLNG